MVRNRRVHKQNQRMVGHFQLLWETGFILASKPKALKEKLKVWSRSDQANLGAKRRNLLKELAVFDEASKGRALTEEEDEVTRKNSRLLEFEELLKYEEISWRQKSRSLWLKNGEQEH